MNILHVIGYLGKAQGGPVESLRLLAAAQAELGNTVRVIHANNSGDGELARFSSKVDVIGVHSYGPVRWSPRMADAGCSNGFQPDVVHSHGMWLDAGRRAARLSKELSIPHVISPCGMLQQEALQRSRWKKRLLWAGFQKGVLLSANIIHAKSHAEASGIQQVLPNSRVRIIAGPVEPSPGDFTTKDWTDRGILASHKVVLFMGRIHPIKGLERLLDAWSTLFEKFSEWRLVIIGPNEDGYREKLKAKFNQKEVQKGARGKDNNGFWSTVLFMDAIYGKERWEAYAGADLFVAPSDFENFGHSIAEALCVGLPVITTTGTPWEELKERNCGWWVNPSKDGIASALGEAMGISDGERRAKGEVGKMIVQKYYPGKIAAKMYALYESLLSERAKSACARTCQLSET